MLELTSSSSSQSPSFNAVMVKSVPLPVSGCKLKSFARSPPRPLEGGTMVEAGRDVSAQGSGDILLPRMP